MLNSATVIHDGNALSASDVVEEIESLGFDASVMSSDEVRNDPVPMKETTFGIVGMTCRYSAFTTIPSRLLTESF